MKIVHPDSYWRHKADGYEVKVEADEERLVKAPGDANWHSAVSYRRTDLEDSPPFTRQLDDFLDKFAPSDEGNLNAA